jgi:hypothetical protein
MVDTDQSNSFKKMDVLQLQHGHSPGLIWMFKLFSPVHKKFFYSPLPPPPKKNRYDSKRFPFLLEEKKKAFPSGKPEYLTNSSV